MILAETETKTRVSIREMETASCPLCGGKMHKSDAPHEKKSHFVWFECDQKNCSGWLVQTTDWPRNI